MPVKHQNSQKHEITKHSVDTGTSPKRKQSKEYYKSINQIR